MSDSLPPGWYPAPDSANGLRWWDGIRWTGEVRDADAGGDAGAAAPGRGGQGTPAAGGAPAEGPEGATAAGAAWRAPAVAAWQARTAPEPRRRAGRWLGKGRRSGKA
jgi:uncharacterized protein DUF2510